MKVGEVIGGRFALRQVIGEGGMGQVFRAWDTDLERLVAIKCLLQQFMSDPAATNDMKQEVRISQRLNHPGIVSVYDFRVHRRTPYIVMEFVDGVPLHHHLFHLPLKRLDEATFLRLADSILAAVGYAHEQGVVHRDLKPANIMLLPTTQVKLMDFGIAAAIKATYTKITGRSSGLTIQYSSPEQINGENPSASMDVYSLGCVFYEMLTGHPPFYQGEVLHQQLTRDPPPMTWVSPVLNQAVLACLAKDPRRRLPNVEAIRAALTGENGRQKRWSLTGRFAAIARHREPVSPGLLQAEPAPDRRPPTITPAPVETEAGGDVSTVIGTPSGLALRNNLYLRVEQVAHPAIAVPLITMGLGLFTVLTLLFSASSRPPLAPATSSAAVAPGQELPLPPASREAERGRPFRAKPIPPRSGPGASRSATSTPFTPSASLPVAAASPASEASPSLPSNPSRSAPSAVGGTAAHPDTPSRQPASSEDDGATAALYLAQIRIALQQGRYEQGFDAFAELQQAARQSASLRRRVDEIRRAAVAELLSMVEGGQLATGRQAFDACQAALRFDPGNRNAMDCVRRNSRAAVPAPTGDAR